MQFNVSIDFKKGPSFSTKIDRNKVEDAKKEALAFARGCGFTDPVKKIVVTPSTE